MQKHQSFQEAFNSKWQITSGAVDMQFRKILLPDHFANYMFKEKE